MLRCTTLLELIHTFDYPINLHPMQAIPPLKAQAGTRGNLPDKLARLARSPFGQHYSSKSAGSYRKKGLSESSPFPQKQNSFRTLEFRYETSGSSEPLSFLSALPLLPRHTLQKSSSMMATPDTPTPAGVAPPTRDTLWIPAWMSVSLLTETGHRSPHGRPLFPPPARMPSMSAGPRTQTAPPMRPILLIMQEAQADSR